MTSSIYFVVEFNPSLSLISSFQPALPPYAGAPAHVKRTYVGTYTLFQTWLITVWSPVLVALALPILVCRFILSKCSWFTPCVHLIPSSH